MAADLTSTSPVSLADEAYRVVVDDPVRAHELATTALRAGRRRDPAAVSSAHRALGMAALELDDAATAVRHLEQAVRASRRAGPQREAEARMGLAFALVGFGSTRRALRQADLAVRVPGVSDGDALQLQHALILERLGRLDEALGAYRLALASFRRGGDRNREARLLCDRGVLQTYRGAFAAAEADLLRAEALCGELGLTLMKASARQNLGFLAAQRGDVPAALDSYARAEEVFRRIGGTRYAILELDRGQLLLSTGLVREARESAERALHSLERTGMRVEVAEAWLQRAEVALAERDWETARAASAAAQHEFAAQARPTWSALARYDGVRARWFEEGPSPRLLAAARRAAEELEQAGWSGRAVRAHLLAGRVALELGRRGDAERELDVARRARRRGPAAARLAGWHAQALHCLAIGNRDAARRAVAAGLRVLDEHRASLGATELRSYAAAQADELARLGLRFALEGGRPAMVLATLERARARSLQLPPVRPPRDAPLAARLGELRAVVALGREEARAGRPSARLVRRQTELEQEIRRRVLQARGSGVVPAVRPPALRELRAALGERALIEYLGLDGRLQAIAVTPRRVRLVELGSVAEAEEEVRLLRFALRRIAAAGRLVGAHRANAAHAAVRLEAMLLAPLLDLVGDRELVIVPTGELHALPWASLPACAARPLSVAPSAALWLRALARRRPASRTLLVAGPDLPHAATEVRALAALYGDAVTLTGEDARVEPVAHALRECDRAHLACHGSFRADNPLFSALLLADGPLTVHDLESLDAAPPELVLSACDSGRAVVRAGDELMGLTSTLLAIGAGVVVASTVAVPDAPTQPLMVRLHRELLGGAGPARALATARGAAEELVARQAFLCFGAG